MKSKLRIEEKYFQYAHLKKAYIQDEERQKKRKAIKRDNKTLMDIQNIYIYKPKYSKRCSISLDTR